MKRQLILALLAVALVAVLLAPRLSRFFVAMIHDPRRLPALATDARIHHEPDALACAETVADALPGAMRRIEAAHGRPFARPPTIGVYRSFDSYARANGLGDPMIAAVALDTRIVLSPSLCGKERARLPSVLAHELSHAHLFGWRGRLASRPPSWFVEGLAVAVSHGGGAEGMSEEEARARIREGRVVQTPERGPWSGFASIRFSGESGDASKDNVAERQRLAFRQAGLFVDWLRARDREAFARLLRRLEAGEDFPPALEAAYGARLSDLRSGFLADVRR
jgi:hypothetical protein